MINRIIQWSLDNRLLVLAAGIVLLIAGGRQAMNTPLDVFPDLTAPSVTIVTEAHGMPPTDVERLISFPVETVMNGASGVRRVRSTSGIGISVITVEFDWGVDIYRARQIVSEKLQAVRNELPADIPAPQLAPVTSIMGEILFVALTSDQHDAMTLKTTADWNVRRRLLAVPGVAEVIPIGGETRQFQVVASTERLAALDITLGELRSAVRESSQNASAGFATENDQEFLIRGVGRADTTEDIGESLVATRDGTPVLVKDVAVVQTGPAPRRGTGSYNGAPAVVLGIQRQPDVNTLELTKRLDTVIADIQAGLPDGMRIETDAFRQSDFIGVSVDNLARALLEGAVLVLAIMFVFLYSARATFIALVAIPLSLLVATLTIRLMGGSINTMTLGGMVIALGALVDDAIIVVENVVRHLKQRTSLPEQDRQPLWKTVYQATREIESSIVFATLIIILVFLPLFFLSGVEGRLLAPLGQAYVVALAASLLVALTVTPVLCLYLLPRSRSANATHDTRLLRWLKSGYRPLLTHALAWPRTIMLLASLLLVIAGLALAQSGRGFLPEFNEGSLTLSVVTLPGTSLETSDDIGQQVEQILLQQPEVTATTRRTGRAELDPHAQQVFASEIDVMLEMADREREELLEALRQEFAALPGTNVVIGQPISHRIDHMLSGTRANIAIKVFGEDLAELRRLTGQIESLAAEVEGAVDVSTQQQGEIPFISVVWDRRALAGYGLRVSEAAESLETAMTGTTVGRIREGDANFDLVVRLPRRHAESIDSIRDTVITTPTGARVPFSALADIDYTQGPNTIQRENVARNMVVMANVSGRDLVGVVNDIRSAVESSVELPAGYHVKYGGQFESAAAANERLMVLGLLVVAGIFLLLYAAFGQLRDALLVMLNLPLALIGGVFGVWLSGNILTVASIIGFIALFGIATRNGVILVDQFRRFVAEGMEVRNAVLQGAEERLAPILMTALATALALVPLALAAGEPGSEIQAPMAIVILTGLFTSTLLNMLVVPALYLHFNQSRKT
ncbi:MAG: efflux RND transporter permease subunit [Pseudohongiellaceae bacterium]